MSHFIQKKANVFIHDRNAVYKATEPPPPHPQALLSPHSLCSGPILLARLCLESLAFVPREIHGATFSTFCSVSLDLYLSLTTEFKF